ncbi:DMT family transporter, partial [Streptococcus pyogenes]|uniref:DMT family transporter n=1 Tax=Streptococcus pyogenes TaxID=1314 RepID=UPI003DA0D00A
ALLMNRAAGEWRGDALFILGGFLFAMFTGAQRASGISPWTATALVNVTSALIFTPIYLLFMQPRLTTAPVAEVLTQVGAQGIAVSVLALWLYSEAVKRLGATRAAVIAALCPAFTAVLAYFILGEQPPMATLAGIVLVMTGVMAVVFGQSKAAPGPGEITPQR